MRDHQAEALGGPEVDHQLEPCWAARPEEWIHAGAALVSVPLVFGLAYFPTNRLEAIMADVHLERLTCLWCRVLDGTSDETDTDREGP